MCKEELHININNILIKMASEVGGIVIASLATYIFDKIKGIDVKENKEGIIVFFIVFLVINIIIHRKFIDEKYIEFRIWINYKFKKKIKLNKVEGFFLRETIVKKILNLHLKDSKNILGIIHGQGGTGKTNLAVNFRKAAKYYCYSYYIKGRERNALPLVDSIRDNSIIFIDYTYEYVRDDVSRGKLDKFISECLSSEKNISIWIIERTNLSRYIMERLVNTSSEVVEIDLNGQGGEPEKLLEAIFEYRLKDKIEKREVSSKELIRLVTEKFDPSYKRPLFADIMSDILLEDVTQDFGAYSGQQTLIERYWEKIIKRKNFFVHMNQVLEGERSRNASDFTLDLIAKSESIILFLKLTGLTMYIYEREHRYIKLQYASGNEYANAQLTDYINNELLIYLQNDIGESKKLRFWILKLLFPFEICEQRNSTNSSIMINFECYDIVCSYLLQKYLQHSNDHYLIKLLSYTHGDFWDITLSFLFRSADEDHGKGVIWWREKFLEGSDIKMSSDLIRKKLDSGQCSEEVKKQLEEMLLKVDILNKDISEQENSLVTKKSKMYVR